LHNGDNVLLIKRGLHKEHHPGKWSGIGGRIEANEHNTPLVACYREILEETGITQDAICALDLLYIIIRKRDDIIFLNYIYFGKTTQTNVTQTDEGELFWLPKNQLPYRQFSKGFAAMLEHYANRNPADRAVYTATAKGNDDDLFITWARCEDF